MRLDALQATVQFNAVRYFDTRATNLIRSL